MKNKITDLNDHMFMMLEKLNDDELTGDELAMECKRASAMAQIGSVIVKNHKNAIDVMKLRGNGNEEEAPEFLSDRRHDTPRLMVSGGEK